MDESDEVESVEEDKSGAGSVVRSGRETSVELMKSSPVSSGEGSVAAELNVELDVEVRKEVRCELDGWRKGSSGWYVAAISVNSSTAKTNKAKQRFPVRRSASWPRFSGRNVRPAPPPKPERERSGRVECIGPVWSGSGRFTGVRD